MRLRAFFPLVVTVASACAGGDDRAPSAVRFDVRELVRVRRPGRLRAAARNGFLPHEAVRAVIATTAREVLARRSRRLEATLANGSVLSRVSIGAGMHDTALVAALDRETDGATGVTLEAGHTVSRVFGHLRPGADAYDPSTIDRYPDGRWLLGLESLSPWHLAQIEPNDEHRYPDSAALGDLAAYEQLLTHGSTILFGARVTAVEHGTFTGGAPWRITIDGGRRVLHAWHVVDSTGLGDNRIPFERAGAVALARRLAYFEPGGRTSSDGGDARQTLGERRILSFESFRAISLRQIETGARVHGQLEGADVAVVGAGYSALLVVHELAGVNGLPNAAFPREVRWFADRAIDSERTGVAPIVRHADTRVVCLNEVRRGRARRLAVYWRPVGDAPDHAINAGTQDRCDADDAPFDDPNGCTGRCHLADWLLLLAGYESTVRPRFGSHEPRFVTERADVEILDPSTEARRVVHDVAVGRRLATLDGVPITRGSFRVVGAAASFLDPGLRAAPNEPERMRGEPCARDANDPERAAMAADLSQCLFRNPGRSSLNQLVPRTLAFARLLAADLHRQRVQTDAVRRASTTSPVVIDDAHPRRSAVIFRREGVLSRRDRRAARRVLLEAAITARILALLDDLRFARRRSTSRSTLQLSFATSPSSIELAVRGLDRGAFERIATGLARDDDLGLLLESFLLEPRTGQLMVTADIGRDGALRGRSVRLVSGHQRRGPGNDR